VKPALPVRAASIFLFTIAFWCLPALSEDVEPLPEEEISKFLDRDRLVDTLMRDDALEVDAARDARDAIQTALDEANENEAPPEVIEELEALLVSAEQALTQQVTDFAQEQEIIEEQVEAMTDDQVFAMNRSLNNTLSNGLILMMGSEDVMRILDENFNAKQINAFTKAFEAEAIFLRQAAKFDEKFAATGKGQFQLNADRAVAKAATEKEKFLGKVDRFAAPVVVDPRDSDPTIDPVVSDEVLAAARGATRDAEKEAHRLAKAASRDAAKESAKELAKGAAKAQARNDAKQLAKAENGNAGRGLATGKNK
jgi:hypothetical protein